MRLLLRFSCIIAVGVTLIIVTPILLLNRANVALAAAIAQHAPNAPSGGSNYLLGVQSVQQQDYTTARAFFHQVDLTHHALARWRMAQTFIAQGQWQDGLPVLTPITVGERQLFVVTLSAHLLDLTPAEDTVWQQRTGQVAPTYTVELARQLLRSGQYTRAESWARTAPQFADSSEAHVVVGDSYFYTERYPEALQAYKTAYQLQPTGAVAYAYGLTLLTLGHPTQAIPPLAESVQRAVNHPLAAWYASSLAIAYAQANQCTEAASTLTLSIKYDSSNENASRIAAAQQTISTLCPLSSVSN